MTNESHALPGPGALAGVSAARRRLRALPGVAASAPLRQALVPWLLPIALVVAWQAAASLGLLRSNVLPGPASVLAAGWRLTLSGELADHIAASTARAVAGLVVGGGLGFALGLLNGLSRSGERLLDSSIQMVRTIPHLALVPLVILWFGIDEEAKLFLVALGVLFPVYVNTFHGIRTVDAQLLEMARSYGMGGLELFRRVVLPGALPSILVGLRYALGIMWLTLIVAETIAARSGIGYLAMNAREFMLVDVVILAILVYALLGKLADVVVRTLERRFLAWHPGFRDA
ncbi:aliphatic sulfonate ABC transporter permease SsuC [Arenibaculum pallidiluteum]|uniref:aliphatic sulfonate ABC transporter permease SsuC n=1 Tax=Arenibaculum pallidiluteum TaxID=2812559 RepID=UPI001A9791D2|nr:aliphatic sulfonate ABC transporter permease SsuC [Arenibaculum pallidiluteum]